MPKYTTSLPSFLAPLPLTTQTYEEAYHTFAKPIETDPSWTFEERRHYIWGTLVEPNLGETGLHLITHFPKEDAALAQTAIVGGKEVAKRYEYYYRGIELANGFLELTDPVEQRARFTEANAKRVALGKAPLPVDPHFLAALEKGLPPSTYGIPAGFDRLFALAHNSPSLIDLLR